MLPAQRVWRGPSLLEAGRRGVTWQACNIFLEMYLFIPRQRGGGREEERERKIHVQGRHCLTASPTHPYWTVPSLGIELVTLHLAGQPTEPHRSGPDL